MIWDQSRPYINIVLKYVKKETTKNLRLYYVFFICVRTVKYICTNLCFITFSISLLVCIFLRLKICTKYFQSNINEAKNFFTHANSLSFKLPRSKAPSFFLFIITITNTNNNYIFIIILIQYIHIYCFNKNTCTETYRCTIGKKFASLFFFNRQTSVPIILYYTA